MAKKTKIADRAYVTQEGAESKRTSPNCVRIEFRFTNGTGLVIDPTKLPESVKHAAMMHGLAAKVSDSFADADGDADRAVELATNVWNALMEGNWSRERGGAGSARVTMLVEALARVTDRPVDECAAKVADMDDDAQKDLKKHPKVKAEMAKIRAERAAAKAKEEAGAADEDAEDLDRFFE